MNSQRLKGRILTYGGFRDGLPVGWHFDCRGNLPGIELTEDGNLYWAGYSLMDLAWEWYAWMARN